MHLILSTPKPINATYRDADSGVVRYKVKTPIKVHDLTTTISRLIDSDVPRREQGDSNTEADSGRFGLLAQIAWYMVGPPTVIRFGGREIAPATFFQKENATWYSPGDRIFTAQDGKEYRWCLTAYTTRLKTNDASATLIAEYRAKSLGLLSKARDPSLQIFPEFAHMVDEIMVTFIYVEKLRKSHIDGNTQL
ncbi:hypothetical protein B0H10DRAFT_2012352 [Mycena sp. CBHHK59/15]|nr:hypothetical protein B0H10DRAFT_2012352 [Mycena sp. CBHHK59/15]